MKMFNSVSLLSDPKSRSCLCSLIVSASLICGVFFVGSAWLGTEMFELSPGYGLNRTHKYIDIDNCKESSKANSVESVAREITHPDKCKRECRPVGTEALPKGIISATSNLEVSSLTGPILEKGETMLARNLLAVAVGIKQKSLVNKIVNKFLANDFVVMLFHYDGIVESWNEEWRDKVIHVSAINQTKWWFAKRFLHPDIVAEYDYIFLWDEDLGVEHFHPGRYVSIIEEEGLEISQPALDSGKSEVHHEITVRRRRSRVHRRYYKFTGGGRCYGNSTAPPCVGIQGVMYMPLVYFRHNQNIHPPFLQSKNITYAVVVDLLHKFDYTFQLHKFETWCSWVEMMAPVFSRAAWRCVWYMIQNDLIHAWGLDMQLGYCAQGDRTVKVGVVDEEYIIHFGLPTLGGLSNENKMQISTESSHSKNSSDLEPLATSVKYKIDNRSAVRLRSYNEMKIFKNRWYNAVKEDECWVNPFKQPQ